jgi:hypothetical protein
LPLLSLTIFLIDIKHFAAGETHRPGAKFASIERAVEDILGADQAAACSASSMDLIFELPIEIGA